MCFEKKLNPLRNIRTQKKKNLCEPYVSYVFYKNLNPIRNIRTQKKKNLCEPYMSYVFYKNLNPIRNIKTLNYIGIELIKKSRLWK